MRVSRARFLAQPFETPRLRLEPLTVEHAEAMVDVLADADLYAVTGGRPPELGELREAYRRQTAGSPRPDESWLNWIVVVEDQPVGFVQATVTERAEGGAADVAWLVGTAYQGQGFATEAASAAIAQLRRQGAVTVTAHIAAGHAPSEGVARRLGLVPTDVEESGERVWALP
jgi:RimJ/RimL family protein N-acetyltransferase